MTDLRTAAQQALEALEDACGDRCNAEYNPCWQRAVAETLRAALVEDALQRFTDVNQEIEAALEQPEQTNYTEEKLQAVAEYVGDKYHVWYGIGARDVEEVLRQSARLGLVTLNSDTVEQPEQEPVAWMYVGLTFNNDMHGPHLVWKPEYMDAMSAEKGVVASPLFTHPPRRDWRGLTEEDMIDIQDRCGVTILRDEFRAIEAKLKERNA